MTTPSTASLRQAQLTAYARDTKLFVSTVMGSSFDRPMDDSDADIWGLIDNESLPYVCICASRGRGKSSVIVGKVIKSILFRHHKYILIVGATEDAAIEISEQIKMELQSNDWILRNYCPPGTSWKARVFKDTKPGFSKSAWFACDPTTSEPVCFINPRGAGQRVRGTKVHIGGRLQRPTLILVDDLEEDDEVLSDERRTKKRLWFQNSLINCIDTNYSPAVGGKYKDRWSPQQMHNGLAPWRIFYMDTLKHYDSNIAHIMADDRWVSRNFPKVIAEVTKTGEVVYRSNWPQNIYSDAQARRDAQWYESNNNIDGFAREFMCLPHTPSKSGWYEQLFIRYHEHEKTINKSAAHRFIVVDPARTRNSTSCPTGMLSVAIDDGEDKIYFRKLVNRRLSVRDIPHQAIDMAVEHDADTIYVEVTGGDDLWEVQFVTALEERGLSGKIAFCPLSANEATKRGDGDFGTGRSAAKIARNQHLLPFYQKEMVLHEWSLKGSAIEKQELEFPDCGSWDALDCGGYVPVIVRKRGIVFGTPKGDGRDKWQHFGRSTKDDWDSAMRQGSWRLKVHA